MVNFDAILRNFWPKDVHTLESWGQDGSDQKGIRAIRDEALETRKSDLRGWLQSYAVFQGLMTAQRDKITEAVLAWADVRNPSRDLTTPEALAEAHRELEEACQACVLDSPVAKKRDFTSLASKALWL